MQTYVTEQYNTVTPIKIVRPNIHKVLVKNLIIISSIVAGIILILVYLDKMVGLDVFMMPLEALGITIDPGNSLSIIISIFVGIIIIFLVTNYLNIINVKYEFYADRIKLYEPTLLVIIAPKEILYKNIIKISYSYDNVINKLLSSGEITIDVNGMKDDPIKMEVIDQTEELVAQLLKIIADYNSLQQMQFEENRRINSIMKKF
jgi:hypothetical protein